MAYTQKRKPHCKLGEEIFFNYISKGSTFRIIPLSSIIYRPAACPLLLFLDEDSIVGGAHSIGHQKRKTYTTCIYIFIYKTLKNQADKRIVTKRRLNC